MRMMILLGKNRRKRKPKVTVATGPTTTPALKRFRHPTPLLKGGDDCPKCKKGKVYEMTEPRRLVRLHGQAPLGAAVYELQKFRCHLCGKIFTAPAPPEVGEKKYDAESAAMIALLKYGSGVPFNRLEGLQGNMGIPLAASTQWDVLTDCVPVFIPIHEALILIAAQGNVIHNDDTNMKVLNLPPLNTPEKAGSNKSKGAQRKGVFTSGIVAIGDGRTIALYFTGHKHAGENIGDVLKHRAAELGPPIQMCDALSRNASEDFKTILANCLTHGRRKFVDVVENFPAECRYVLELLGKVYENDETTRREKMSDHDRLIYHQANSKELMDDLERWMRQQLDDKLVEPNSSLGGAIAYMLKHWKKLTLFLRVAGAPLDKDYASQCTSLSGSQVNSISRRLSNSFWPFFLTGRFSPTGS